MVIGLAVCASIGWGAADFFGGAARRRTPALVIVAISELAGLGLVVPILIARGTPLPTSPRMLGACVAGVAVTVELGLIYRALSRGDAFITAPVGALGAALAVGAGLVQGDPLDPLIAAGLACALLGGAVSAWTSANGRAHRGSALRNAGVCIAAATAVATMLISFHAAGRLDPYWATAVVHASTAVSAGLAALVQNGTALRRRLPHRPQFPAMALAAIGGVGGDLAYAAGSGQGALSIQSAISSLYPITTIVLGMALQGRRAGRVQAAGVVLAVSGAAMLGAAAH
jgi:drug/metabolite transporter (DMT)-like permease